MTSRWARVPIELVELVDAPALQLYVTICSCASWKDGTSHVTNVELARRTRQSTASVARALRQLVDVGVIERRGRQRRVLRVVDVAALSITAERKSEPPSDHHGSSNRSQVIDIPRSTNLDEQQSASHSAAPDERIDMDDAALFAIDDSSSELEVSEKPIGAAALAAFFDEYGSQPISRPMIGRLGKELKRCGETYGRELVVDAARSMGRQHVVNPNAVEPFVLRLQRERSSAQSGWSRLAADTFERDGSAWGAASG